MLGTYSSHKDRTSPAFSCVPHKHVLHVLVQNKGEHGLSTTFTQINYHLFFQSVPDLSVIYNLQLLCGKPKPCHSNLCAWVNLHLDRAKIFFGSSWLWVPSPWHHIRMGPGMTSEVSVLPPPQEQTVLQDSGSTQTHLTCCHLSRSSELPLRTLMWLAYLPPTKKKKK